MEEKKTILKLENVYKTYMQGGTKTHALNNIDLDIKSGEIVVILGPSGAGKTTLLNVLSGLDSPTSGRILFDGKDIAKYSQMKLTKFRKENLGFIFQTYNLLEHLNVKENVMVGAKLGKSKDNVDEIIEVVGLSNHKKKYMHELSGGEQQRVSIARALAKKPSIMFADEPTGALDEKTGKIVLRTLIEANEKLGTTMIIVTHNPGIAKIGDRVLHVNSGVIDKEIINETRMAPEEIPWG
ncbi:MAG: ABC transporter ATP-binding protein [Clostridia bacterium]|nr:ABC transporter ATP-binding protein [Clostridia bacterium]